MSGALSGPRAGQQRGKPLLLRGRFLGGGDKETGRRGGDFLRGRGELGCVGDSLDALSFCCCDWPLRIVK